MQQTSSKGKIETGGISHIAIEVKDLDRSINFYTSLFNIGLTSKSDKMAFLNTQGKHDSLAFFKSEGEVRHCGLNHFGFFVDDVNFDRAMEYIRSNSIRILGGPGRWSGGARYVYIEDPDGYKVQISTE